MSLFQEIGAYVDVLLPLPLENAFTYAVPPALVEEIQVGKRVVVPFQKGKFYSGLIINIHADNPTSYPCKMVEEVLDVFPLLEEKHLQFWKWMSQYYLSPLGLVMNQAFPSALKLASKTILLPNPDFDAESEHELSDQEFLLLEAIQIRGKIDLDEAAKIIRKRSAFGVVRSLIQKGGAIATEEMNEKVAPKIENFISIHPQFQGEAALRILFEKLEKAPKQLDILLVFLQLAKDSAAMISRKTLLKHPQAHPQPLSALLQKGVLVQTKQAVSRLVENSSDRKEMILSEAQSKSLDEINDSFSQFSTVLFRGITGSGKTAIYIKLIEEQIKLGKQVLFLVPEIALTTQLVGRIRQVFGEVGVYHSKMNEQERVELFNAVVMNQFSVVLGVRSGVFLPFSNLGLIIVDEEHDTAYKQQDPSPRFHARDCAFVLGQLHAARVLLGSATPSIESYYAAKSGKIGLVELDERFGEAIPPAIELVDLVKAKEQGAMKDYFSWALLAEIQEKVENHDQVILFRNRRGYHPVQQCSTCGKLVECPKCDVSLNYHKGTQNLVCHYCGYQEKSVSHCKACGSEEISMLGFGTEKVEEDIQALFPDFKVERLDQDVTKKKSAFKDIFKSMEEGKVDILVGTQMISKGLDFENVTLVGVLNADQSLSWTDFRAVERTFQQLMQVSGRAGRHAKKGKVLIQTRQPKHPIFSFLQKQHFPSFYEWQIAERREFGYPPFSKMILITLSGKKEEIVVEASELMAKKLRLTLPKGTLGPVPPPVSKINNRYYRQIQVKYHIEKIKPQTIKAHLHDLQKALQGAPIFKSIFISIDVDPT